MVWCSPRPRAPARWRQSSWRALPQASSSETRGIRAEGALHDVAAEAAPGVEVLLVVHAAFPDGDQALAHVQRVGDTEMRDLLELVGYQLQQTLHAAGN